MKVYEIQSFGMEGLKQVERPEPAAPGPGQVLVDIKYSSLNYRDYLSVIGEYNPKQKLPLIPNCDGAGIVSAVGPDVKSFKVGEAVTGVFAQEWQAGVPGIKQLKSTLGGPLDGMLCEKRLFPETGLVKLPEWMDLAQGATLTCAGVTAWNALVQSNLKAGQTVLILGTGGVSIFALQFAKAMGLRVIITSSSDEKLERAKELGADFTINYKDKPNWSKEVRRITRMEGVDLVIEVGGPGTMEHSLASVKAFGQVSLIGVLAGKSQELNLTGALMQNIRIQGIVVGSRVDFLDMLKLIERAEIKPVVDKIFPFEQATEAFEYMRAGKHFGKICVQVSA